MFSALASAYAALRKEVDSWQTATSRTEPSAPSKLLLERGLLRGRILDFGCGKGDLRYAGELSGVHEYDPKFRPDLPAGRFDTIVCNYVLNVLPPSKVSGVVSEVKGLLRPGGTAYFGVRRDVGAGGRTGPNQQQHNVELGLPTLVDRAGAFAIYVLHRHRGRMEFESMMRLALSGARKSDEPGDEPAKQVDYQGIQVVVDRPIGFVQTGTAPDGTEWERTYTHDYGYIAGTLGGDGEGLDVFLGGEVDAQTAHWVTQRGASGAFDEFKVMMGFPDQAAAVEAYLAHVPKEFFGGVTPVAISAMQALLGVEPKAGIALEKASADAQAWVRKRRAQHVRTVLADLHSQYPEELSAALVDVMKAADLPVLREVEVEPYKSQVMHDGLPDRVCKTAAVIPEEHYLLGIVLEPDIVDSQGDTYSAADIESTAHAYMQDYRNVGLQHKALINNRVKVVESWLTKVDQEINGSQIKAGTWMMAVKIYDPELWAQVKSGELSGFSIAGFATRTPISD